jgi:hypothetical protein
MDIGAGKCPGGIRDEIIVCSNPVLSHFNDLLAQIAFKSGKSLLGSAVGVPVCERSLTIWYFRFKRNIL